MFTIQKISPSTIVIVFVALIILFSQACNKKGDSSNKPINSSSVIDIQTIQDFLYTQVDGSFGIINSTGLSAQEGDWANVTGGFYDQLDPSQSTRGIHSSPRTATIGGFDVLNNNKNYQTRGLTKTPDHLFGTMVEFVIGNKSTRSIDNVATDTMYLPEKLILSDPVIKSAAQIFMSDGSTVLWNADAKNDKGVVIIVSYNPDLNIEEIPKVYPEEIAKTIVVPDNGEYTFTKELLVDFPTNAVIEITLARGNFQFSKNQPLDETYSLYGYSAVNFLCILK